MRRESVRLAFVAALHTLSAPQRATLILRDVLKFSADETAGLLGITVAAANGLLRRARGRLAERPAPAAGLTGTQRALLARFVEAFERYDVPALTALLHEDATLAMPPYGLWLAGRTEISRWFRREDSPCRASRLVPIEANGSPAFAIYHDEGGLRAFAVLVVDVAGDRVAALEAHLEPRLFGLFGLPAELAVAQSPCGSEALTAATTWS